MYILVTLNLILIVAALFLNTLGIYAICKERCTLHSCLLINLSATEIFILLHQTVEVLVTLLCPAFTNFIYSKIMSLIYLTGSWEFYVTILFILSTRTAAVIFPIRYMIYNTSLATLRTYLIVSWVFSIAYGYIFKTLEDEKIMGHDVIIIYFIILNSLYSILCLITFIIIAKKTQTSGQKSSRNSTKNTVRRRSEKLYRTSTLILLTFVIFNAIPMCLWRYRSNWQPYLALVNHASYIIDPLIYIYMNHKYRNIISSTFSRRKTSSSISHICARHQRHGTNG